MTKSRTKLATDDPRHGTNAGSVAGCDCTPCSDARRRFKKQYELRLLAGERIRYTPDEVAEIIGPWIRMGFTENAIRTAAGLSPGHPLLGTTIKATSYHAIAALTDTDFDAAAIIPSDLTKRRIGSLMAVGHPLKDMPINACGLWRTRDRIACGIARGIRDYYAAHEFQIGPSRITATKARNAGHVPPLAWDDPRTVAWPTGRPGRITGAIADRDRINDLDPIVVERFLARDFTPGLWATKAEKREIVRRWDGTHNELARLTGWKIERYTDRQDGAA